MSMLGSRSYAAEMQAEINVTPLIDVMLALVVVFMITAPLLIKHFALPLMGSNEGSKPVDIVHLAIAADGALTWNDHALPAPMLKEQLRVLALRVPQPELRIDVDRAAAYQTFAAALADAKVAKIEKIGVTGVSRP